MSDGEIAVKEARVWFSPEPVTWALESIPAGDPMLGDVELVVQAFDQGAVTTATLEFAGLRFDGCAKRHPDDDEHDNPLLGRALAMQRALQSAAEYYEDFVRQIRRGTG